MKLVFCEHSLFEPDAGKRELYFRTTAGKKATTLMPNNTLEKSGYKQPKAEYLYDEE